MPLLYGVSCTNQSHSLEIKKEKVDVAMAAAESGHACRRKRKKHEKRCCWL